LLLLLLSSVHSQYMIRETVDRNQEGKWITRTCC